MTKSLEFRLVTFNEDFAAAETHVLSATVLIRTRYGETTAHRHSIITE